VSTQAYRFFDSDAIAPRRPSSGTGLPTHNVRQSRRTPCSKSRCVSRRCGPRPMEKNWPPWSIDRLVRGLHSSFRQVAFLRRRGAGWASVRWRGTTAHGSPPWLKTNVGQWRRVCDRRG